MKTVRIAVLALQGAFIEHEQMLRRLGADVFEIRQLADWQQPKDGLILPGGESTTQAKLLRQLGLLQPIRHDIEAGLPVFGTCAGLILLAREIVSGQAPVINSDATEASSAPSASSSAPFSSSLGDGREETLSTMDIRVRRNAYGRQLGSFSTEAEVRGIGTVPMTFIRAPWIESVYGQAEALAEVDGHIVAARQGNQLVTAFHPELNDDPRIHQHFLNLAFRHSQP